MHRNVETLPGANLDIYHNLRCGSEIRTGTATTFRASRSRSRRSGRVALSGKTSYPTSNMYIVHIHHHMKETLRQMSCPVLVVPFGEGTDKVLFVFQKSVVQVDPLATRVRIPVKRWLFIRFGIPKTLIEAAMQYGINVCFQVDGRSYHVLDELEDSKLEGRGPFSSNVMTSDGKVFGVVRSDMGAVYFKVFHKQELFVFVIASSLVHLHNITTTRPW